MKKNQLEKKQTKLTITTFYDCWYEESTCEFKVSQQFYTESEDIDEIFNELMYFIKMVTSPSKKTLMCSREIHSCHINFESYSKNEEVSEFYDKLITSMLDLTDIEIECSDEILEYLTEEQKENMGDACWWMFEKLNPKYKLKKPTSINLN